MKKVKTNKSIELEQLNSNYEKLKIKYKLLKEKYDLAKSKSAVHNNEFEIFHAIYENAPIGIALTDTSANILRVNRRFSQMLGYTQTELINKNIREITYPDDLESEISAMRKIKSSEREIYSLKKRYIKKNSEIIWVNLTTNIIRNAAADPMFVLGLAEDITEKNAIEKRLIESEEIQRIILKSSEDIIVMIDKNLKYLYYNGSPKFNLTANDLIGKTPYDFFSKEAADRIVIHVQKVFQSKRVERRIDKINWAGEDIWFDVVNHPVFNDHNEVIAVTAFSRNITERMLANIQLEKSLKEKELLLKEIHHRVKNNLNVVIGLLELQMESISDEILKEAFSDSTKRIRSMALIHEHLYQNKDLSGIQLARYLEHLVDYIVSSHTDKSKQILTDYSLENIFIGIDQAIPCGLIVNEVVTNSIKYAFAGKHKGKIAVKLTKLENDFIKLDIIDDGVGLPEDFNLENSSSLGLQLINLLIQQLKAVYEIKKNGGTSVQITFKPA